MKSGLGTKGTQPYQRKLDWIFSIKNETFWALAHFWSSLNNLDGEFKMTVAVLPEYITVYFHVFGRQWTGNGFHPPGVATPTPPVCRHCLTPTTPSTTASTVNVSQDYSCITGLNSLITTIHEMCFLSRSSTAPQRGMKLTSLNVFVLIGFHPHL